MNRHFSEILQSTFSIFAFIGIIVISATVVLNLNPVAISEDAAEVGPKVAGISTNIQSLNFINTAYESENYKTQLDSSPERVVYSASFDKFTSEFGDQFLKIQNTSPNSGGFSIVAVYPSKLSDIIQISIIDTKDVIYLKNNEARRISVDANSERSFIVNYALTQPINYSFKIDFVITN